MLTAVATRFARSKRTVALAAVLALMALGFTGVHSARSASAAASGLYVDLRTSGYISGGQVKIRVCNYGNYTSRAFATEFWVGGRYYVDSSTQLVSGGCATWNLGALSCGTSVTAIADRAYRTTGYNYGANRYDGRTTC